MLLLVQRTIEIISAIFICFLISPICLSISMIIKFTSDGPILFWSERVGKNSDLFRMPKFRTMTVGTPQVATHLLDEPSSHLTKFGVFLRKFSLDELPQIISILRGHMKFIGPRPALFNQYDLISLRKEKGIDIINPGITGWAQVNGRDDLTIEEKVEYDEEYLMKKSFLFDMKIIFLTFLRVLKKDGVSH